MAEQVRVFQNLVDQAVAVTATDVVLHTTSSTQRAVLRDLDCINLGPGATLDLDGRTMNTGTSLGKLERTKSLIMGPSSTLKLKFPAKDSIGFLGMFFFNGTGSNNEGINLVTDANVINEPVISSLGSLSVPRSSGFVHKPLVTDDPYFFAMNAGVIYKHDINGDVVSQQSTGSSGIHQMGSDGTYIYYIKSATVLGRMAIADLTTSDVTTTGISMAIPGDNQGSYVIYYNGKVYSKLNGGSTAVTITTLATSVVTSKTDGNLAVGSYSDGATLVTNRAGVPFIVEQGTTHTSVWNMNTDAVIRVSGGAGSTEYGNGGAEIQAGIALIVGEETDRVTIVDTNFPVPTVTVYKYPDNPYQLNNVNGSFGNRYALAGGLVPIEPRKFSAYVAGIDITED
jgi:hypothetical protein